MKHEPTHLDLFSGLGGFALAAKWAGYRTITFCENDPRCRDFLSATWGLPICPDIRELDGRFYRGISLLTGGPPCQPASRAGDQRGKGDDRWLWGEALRVLEEAQPDSVVFENPVGIEDVGLDGILSEMERIGYEVQPFCIPACAVDSPQIRDRYWIVGFLGDSERGRPEQREPERESLRRAGGAMSESNLANSTESGLQGADPKCSSHGRAPQCAESHDNVADTNQRGEQREGETAPEPHRIGPNWWIYHGGDWDNFVWVPCADSKLRRAPDQSLDVVNGLHRSVLAALGNSIVPQIAYEILRAIKKERSPGSIGESAPLDDPAVKLENSPSP